MDNKHLSDITVHAISFSTQSRQLEVQNTVAQLLNDKDAMSDWVANIGKIRQVEASRATQKNTSV